MPLPQPRRPAPTIEQQLDREVDALDRLVGEVRHGICGPAHYDQLEEQAEAIARRLRKVFRKCST